MPSAAVSRDEWAKKPECRDAVLGASYSAPSEGMPEVR